QTANIHLNQNKRNKQQKVEKTSSKIEKRTFND
ncbi:hypothetical protein D592_04625, partial [Staphylococcus epidermidis 36-1]